MEDNLKDKAKRKAISRHQNTGQNKEFNDIQ
jgi:hypothetical protein